jgi:hypothetical protein
MLYEGMLKKLTEKRVVTSRGVKHVSASEVLMPINLRSSPSFIPSKLFLFMCLQLSILAYWSSMTHDIMHFVFWLDLMHSGVGSV